ncbi:MAG TPA: Spy/CpxP family protein refolding chaperone, partial [Xanthobacteraceae bacterium]|nr:Spy/CpxP family protein refolding chaperone [Xanthobacteraceae bacterium]
QQSEAQQPPASPFDRLARRADAMAKTSAALKKMADAGAPLYASLNDEQKGRFVKLAHILRPHPHGFMQHGWHQGFGHQGFGHQGFGPGRFGGDDGDDGGDTGSRL